MATSATPKTVREAINHLGVCTIGKSLAVPVFEEDWAKQWYSEVTTVMNDLVDTCGFSPTDDAIKEEVEGMLLETGLDEEFERLGLSHGEFVGLTLCDWNGTNDA
jgi:hypothetical protein